MKAKEMLQWKTNQKNDCGILRIFFFIACVLRLSLIKNTEKTTKQYKKQNLTVNVQQWSNKCMLKHFNELVNIFFFSFKGSDEKGTTLDSRQSDTFMKDDIS